MPTPSETAAADRARRRGAWPVRSFRLGEEPGDDLSRTTTPVERIAMVASLTGEAWAMSGKATGRIPRSAWPVAVVGLSGR